ncbi:hypothetical protein [Amycolatopsis sp. NPDC051372]|uniref:hypothetical protein n=1 Tax=unclassified Amycolatopsis TaxID=2618356 RepID=UPI00342D632D
MTTKAQHETDHGWLDFMPWSVRRRDLREPGAKLPLPDPPAWQRGGAIVADLAIHLTIAIVVTMNLNLPVLPTLIGTYTVVSFVHRVLLQRWWGATTGRALFVLRYLITTTGAKPSFGVLLKAWLVLGYFALFGGLGYLAEVAGYVG